MRLIHRHRSRRPRVPRIRFTQEEIAADLHYPASRRARLGGKLAGQLNQEADAEA
jgi:hypothetical protein